MSSKPPDKERRRARRVDVCLPVSVRTPGAPDESVGTVFNLSQSGAFLRTARPVEPGGAISIRFDEGASRRVRHPARVARTDGLHGVGVQFDETGDDLRAFVRKLLGAVREVHRGADDGD